MLKQRRVAKAVKALNLETYPEVAAEMGLPDEDEMEDYEDGDEGLPRGGGQAKLAQ